MPEYSSPGRELPLLFNTDMTKATLAGIKTVTRRIIKARGVDRVLGIPEWHGETTADDSEDSPPVIPFDVVLADGSRTARFIRAPYKAGDVLYVREAFAEMPYGVVYRADDDDPEGWDIEDRWRPSIHMPKDFARIFLRVKSVLPEQLQEIKDEECVAEGAVKHPHYTKRHDLVLLARYRDDFAKLWDSTVKPDQIEKYGWEANPWVWAIRFERTIKGGSLN